MSPTSKYRFVIHIEPALKKRLDKLTEALPGNPTAAQIARDGIFRYVDHLEKEVRRK
jgi:hypothetical protein